MNPDRDTGGRGGPPGPLGASPERTAAGGPSNAPHGIVHGSADPAAALTASQEPAPAPAMPEGLGPAGTALWQSLTAAYTFEAREAALLVAAARQCDDVAALEALITADGPTVTGSRGQQRLSGAFTEVRQGRLALARLLGELALPADDVEVGVGPASAKASHAARTRWGRVARREEVPRGTAA